MVAARIALAISLLVLPDLAVAESNPVELDPIRFRAAALSVAGTQGDQKYEPLELEALGASRLITKTPWREDDTVFDGVLLTDILEAHGLMDVSAIRVIAENDYAITIPAEVWQTQEVLVATRVNGRAHTRRERGPIQFVLPMSDDESVGTGDWVNYWVWMAARIEPVE